jgi:hypothetical protein
MRIALTLAMALTAMPAFADVPLLWTGHLEDATGPIDRTVSATFIVKDQTDAVLSTLNEPSLLVVEGDFVIELQVPEAAGLRLAVVINGSSLEPDAPLPIQWPSAARADTAGFADVAENANAIGVVTEPLTIARLATPGAVSLPFTNLLAFPSDFLDGDDGLDFAAGATIDFSAGTIGIKAGSLPGTSLSGLLSATKLAPATLTTADFANGSVTAAKLQGIPRTKIANGALSGRHFSGTKVPVFEVTDADCGEGLNTVTTAASCSFVATVACDLGLGVQGRRDCRGGCQVTANANNCPNTPAGVLVFP